MQNIKKAHTCIIRHLQILSGMERLKYVIVYWILITKIEAIFKKKVTKITTASLKKFGKEKIIKIMGKKRRAR